MMKHLDQHIVELVLRYEHVILPKLGCLTKSINFTTDKEHTFSKEEKLSFEQNAKLNDGMLYKYVSIKENISLTESQIMVDQYVSNLKINVFNNKSIPLSALGTFSLSENDIILFTYNSNFRIFPEYNGLTSFNRQPIIRKPLLNVEKSSKRSKAWYWATAGLIPLLGISIYFGLTRQKLDKSAIPTTAGLSEISTTTFHSLDLSKLEDVNFDGLYEEEEEYISFTRASKIKKGYQIVLGVFGDLTNAKKLANLNSNLSHEVIISPYKNMYKVSTLPYKSKLTAQTELNTVRKINPTAWLYRLK